MQQHPDQVAHPVVGDVWRVELEGLTRGTPTDLFGSFLMMHYGRTSEDGGPDEGARQAHMLTDQQEVLNLVLRHANSKRTRITAIHRLVDGQWEPYLVAPPRLVPAARSDGLCPWCGGQP